MKNTVWLFAVSTISAWVAMPPVEIEARDSDDKSLTFAAAQISKPKQTNACRARYRDCLKLNQIPAFECQYIYTDCMNHIY